MTSNEDLRATVRQQGRQGQSREAYQGPSHCHCEKGVSGSMGQTKNSVMIVVANNRQSPGWTRLRFNVLKRDMFTCVYCGGKPPNVLLHVDHLVPVSDGGLNEIDNLVAACSECNSGKGNDPLGVSARNAIEGGIGEYVERCIGTVSMQTLRCVKCGYTWYPRKTEIKTCPKCKRKDWEKGVKR